MTENIDVILKLTDLITPQLNKVNNQLTTLSEKVNKIQKNINGGAAGSKGGGGMFGQIFGANLLTGVVTQAIGLATSAVSGLATSIFDSYTNLEGYETKLTGMLQGNSALAKTHIKEMQLLAKSTPFELKDIQAADNLLLAYGYTVEQTASKIRLFGDVAAGTAAPGSTGDIAGIIAVMGQIKGKNKADTRDLYQFAERGIPIFAELAKAMNVPISKVQDLAAEGKIGEREVTKAFQNMGSKGGLFYQAMERQSKTTLGRISNIKDTLYQIGGEIGTKLKPMFDLFLDTTSKTITSVSKMMDNVDFDRLNKYFTNLFNKIVEGFKTNFNLLKPIFQPVMELIGLIIEHAVSINTEVQKIFKDPTFKQVFADLGDLIKSLTGLLKQGFSIELITLIKIIKGAIVVMQPFLKILSGVINLITTIFDFLTDRVQKFGKLFGITNEVAPTPVITSKQWADFMKNQYDKNKPKGDGVNGKSGLKEDKIKVDTFQSQQPKVVNVNILSGNNASLIQNMDVTNIVDKNTGGLTQEFRTQIESYLMDVLLKGQTTLY